METTIRTKPLDRRLSDFAASVSPSMTLLRIWNIRVHKLIQDLKIEFKDEYSIDRHIISGSQSKKTAIMYADYDCILFFNDDKPPFEEILTKFETYLGTLECVSSLKTGKHSVQFTLDNALHVDLLPAPNFVKSQSRKKMIAKQRKNTLHHIHNLINSSKADEIQTRREYSSSFEESKTSFMTQRSAFAKTVVKSAKIWFKLVAGERFNIFGLKYMIELVAVFYARQEEIEASARRRKVSVTLALENIFNNLASTKTLRINFNVPDKWDLASKKESFVIDPTNPLDDVLYRVRKADEEKGAHALQDLERYAKLTLANIGLCINDIQEQGPPRLERELSWLSTIFHNYAFAELRSESTFTMEVCFTHFKSWEVYINAMGNWRHDSSVETKINRDTIIEASFQTGVIIAREVTGNFADIRKIIIRYMNVREDENLKLFRSNNGSCVLPFSDSSESLTAKVKEIRRFNPKVFIMPMKFASKDISPVYNKSGVYCCVMVLLENMT